FEEAVGQNRRDFLKQAALAGVVSGGSLGAFYFGYQATLSRPVRVGVLGTGDEGSVLIGAINPDFLQVRAIADLRPYNIHRAFEGDWYSPDALAARPGLLAKYGWKSRQEAEKHVAVYRDYNELLEDAKKLGLEAVIIALPLHLHAPAALKAMEKGLHVFTEKLMARTIGQCKDMGRASRQKGLYLAVGHQRHYNILYHEAVDLIRRGVLGDLHYIRAQWHRGNLPGSDSWAMPLPPGVKDPKQDRQANRLTEEWEAWKKRLAEAQRAGRLQEIIEWQKKVAQKEAQINDKELANKVQEYGYEDKVYKNAKGEVVYHRPAIEELIRWRLWDRTSGGLMAELGSHQLDAAGIFIAAAHEGVKQLPLNVVASATRPLFPADRDIEDHMCCIIEFPAPGYVPGDPVHGRKKITVQYASINGNGFGGYGEVVFGTDGTLILEREKESMLFREGGQSRIGAAGGGGPTLDTQASGPAQRAEGGGPARDVSRGYAEELEHWAWCIRNPAPENQPRCHPEVALVDAVIALTANMAGREGRRIVFEPAWFDMHRDETPEGVPPSIRDQT
ncbi:MAG TPA: Gfo/Idh/MocA family oxidoreductase, partial [Thermoguttaceae bacterium]|nr:Gfo/Idh/MocA family oxidoreductase [Thermoguttaceae bacterium]